MPKQAGSVSVEFTGISSTGINSGWVPPDNAMAVGSANVLMVENSAIEWTSLTGQNPALQTLSQFFQPLSPYGLIYDPRAFYDSVNGRYVVVADESNSSSTQSNLLVAVSKDSNPADGWYFQSINSALTVGGQVTTSDYPQVAVDGAGIYITTNQFDSAGNFIENVLYQVSDFSGSGGGLYAGGQSVVVQTPNYGSGFSYHPLGVPGVGVFYVSYLGGSQLSIQEYSPTTNSFSAWNTVSLGNIDVGNGNYTASEKGSHYLIDAGDGRITSLAYDQGQLYGVMEIVPPGSTLPTVHWFELNVSSPDAVTLVAQGNIPGGQIGSGVATFNPSIAVDGSGAVLINFTASGPRMVPTDYFAIHLPTDPATSFGTPVAYQASHGPYTYNTADYGGGFVLRWGDYSSALADPATANGFWVSNEYGAGNQNWATVVADVIASPAPSGNPPPGHQPPPGHNPPPGQHHHNNFFAADVNSGTGFDAMHLIGVADGHAGADILGHLA